MCARCVERGVRHYVKLRRQMEARQRRTREAAACKMLMRQVLVIRAKRERRRRQEARRLQLAEARAGALQAAHSAISRLAQAWQHPPALEVALKAAEAAARHPALPPGWSVGAECAPRLAAASAQLRRLGELAWEQVEIDAHAHLYAACMLHKSRTNATCLPHACPSMCMHGNRWRSTSYAFCHRVT